MTAPVTGSVRDRQVQFEAATRSRSRNLALRQQLALLRHKTKRPRLTKVDRVFWVALSRLWSDWRRALVVVKPQTVIDWHRKGFKLYWTWKSRKQGGRPQIDSEIRLLIRRIATENVGWGAPRIHAELIKLGFEVGVERQMSARFVIVLQVIAQDASRMLLTHKDPPETRARESTEDGHVVALPLVGGLHHRYTRLAA